MKEKISMSKMKFMVAVVISAIVAAGIIGAFSAPNRKGLHVLPSIGAHAESGKLYDETKNEFDSDELQKLCAGLIGDTGGIITPDDMKSYVNTNGDTKFGSTVAAVGDVAVELGGRGWVATSLVISNSGDVGLTLLSAASIGSPVFETNYEGQYTPSGTTPCVMYSTSSLRKNTIMTITPLSEEFIIKPTAIAYQLYQTGDPVRANEALTVTTGCAFLDTYKFHEKAGYSDWGSDNVWLPSYTEATVIWNKVSLFSAGARTRSTKTDSDRAAMQLLNSGSRGDVDRGFPVHVAFHLNLTKALESAGRAFPKNKSATNIQYYTGSDLSFTLTNVDTKSLDVSDVTYCAPNGTTALPTSTSTVVANSEWTLTAREVGKYTVKIKPKQGILWIDRTTTEKEYEFYIKYKVAVPNFGDDANTVSKTYDKNGQKIPLSGFDDDFMNINIDSIDTSQLSFNKATSEFSVTKAKAAYNVKAELKDKTFMVWDSATAEDTADKPLTITITKQQIVKPALLNPTQNSKPYTGSEVSFPLANYTPNSGVTIKKPAGADVDDTAFVLKATSAGQYSFNVSLADTDNTEWKSGGIASYDLSVTVARKTLFADFTSSTGAYMLEAGSEVTFGAVPNNAVAGDEVKLTLFYGPVSSGEKALVADGSLETSELNPGSYYLYATLEDGAAADNKNYVLNGGEVKKQFTVGAKNLTLDKVEWQYSQNNGAPTDIDISGGIGGSATSPFTKTYNGKAFVFSVKTDAFAASGVKIDVSYGSGGYVNSMQTNAMSSAVGVTVRVVPLDSQYAFHDQNGTLLAQQYKDFTLYVKINKAEVDFSEVKWSAEELEYNAVNQTVRIASGFPTFLTPSYNTASTGRDVNDYQAKVTGVTVSNATTAANYNVPSAAQLATIPELTHDWKIVRKKINVSWKTVEETGEGGTVIFVPTLLDNSANAVEYTYYNEDKSQAMTLGEIFADYDATQLKKYWVCVKLKTSGTYNATNCALVEGGEEVNESFHDFEAGENKNPVRVGLKTNQTEYNRAEQPAEIEFEGGNLVASDFEISYKRNDVDCDTPKNAGTYKVIVKLKSEATGDYAITGQCEFDYEIKKADYDVSSMKWVDTLNGNAEYTEAYVWAYDEESDTKGKVHTLSFVGEDIDGLNIGYTSATEDNLTGSNAGTYKVSVEFSVVDPLNYNVPENLDFTWEIKPFAPDLSEVKWNYESAFTFRIGEDGQPVKYSVRLINLPDGLEELITYSGDDGEYSDAGGYATTFEVDTTSAMCGNFVTPLVFGAGVENRLVWEIKSLTIEKPQQRQTQAFRQEGYTFREITNLPEDWERYFTVEVVDGDNDSVQPEEGTWKFTEVNQYRIKIQFKQGMNTSVGGAKDNVKWSDNGRAAYQVSLTIKTLEFPVRGWIDQGENVRPLADADDVTEIEKYFDYVLYDTEAKQEIPLNTPLEWETVYTIALKLKVEYAGNVAVKYLGKVVEETMPYAFQTDVDPLADPPVNFYRKPTGEELQIAYRYTGNKIEFKPGNWFVPEKMQIMYGSATEGTDEGQYLMRVGFKKGALSAWQSEEEGFDRVPVTITYIISADAKANDRFILKDIYKENHPYKFLYANFNEANDVEGYEYDASNLLYIARLALGDTLANLLAQFENADEITAWTSAGVQITDLTTVLATGMALRIMEGETVLNQLILSVLGDVNGDGRVNVTDKTQINANLAGKRQLEVANLLACDVNGDGRINVTDKTQVNAQLAGKRDIYAGLSLKATKTANNASAPMFVSEAVELTDAEITLGAEVPEVVTGQENSEFTVILKIENNTATGGLEIVLTSPDENATVGDSNAKPQAPERVNYGQHGIHLPTRPKRGA